MAENHPTITRYQVTAKITTPLTFKVGDVFELHPKNPLRIIGGTDRYCLAVDWADALQVIPWNEVVPCYTIDLCSDDDAHQLSCDDTEQNFCELNRLAEVFYILIVQDTLWRDWHEHQRRLRELAPGLMRELRELCGEVFCADREEVESTEKVSQPSNSPITSVLRPGLRCHAEREPGQGCFQDGVIHSVGPQSVVVDWTDPDVTGESSNGPDRCVYLHTDVAVYCDGLVTGRDDESEGVACA